MGFVGHLDQEDPADAARVGEALRILGEAFKGLPTIQVAHDPPTHPGHPGAVEHLGQAYGAALQARLLTGAARGGDQMAIGAWRGQNLGPVHALFPFRDPATGGALTDAPERAGAAERVEDLSAFDAWSGLDGARLGLGGDQSHVEVGRWIVRASDILVALWDETRARKPGGAADSVTRALEAGIGVVWVRPGDDQFRLIPPHDYLLRAEVLEAAAQPLEHAQPLTADAVRALLAPALKPPLSSKRHEDDAHDHKKKQKMRLDPEVAARRDYASLDPLPREGSLSAWFSHWVWGAFAAFRYGVGGLASWTAPFAETLAKPEGLEALAAYGELDSAFAQADARADHLAAIHRSEQLLLALAAPLAVSASILPVFAAQSRAEALHVLGALVEFALGVGAFVVFRQARRAHRHRRWSDARRLAERLRTVVALWPLGIDLADGAPEPSLTWTEWRARALVRAAGPPQGWLDRPAFEARARWAVCELIGGQINYHAKEGHASHTIDAWIERTELGAFGFLMAALFLFLLVWLAHFLGMVDLGHGQARELLLQAVLVLGPLAPAVGAAGLALRATNGFAESARRSQALEPEYRRLAGDFRKLDREGVLSLRQAQQILREAARLLVEDADSWRDRLASRKTERGG